MSIADLILLVLLAFGAYGGYRKGLVLEVISLLALVLGVVGGIKLMNVGMDILSSFFDGLGILMPVLGFLFVFVLIIVAVTILGQVLKKVIDWTPLGPVDHVAGAVLGIFKFAFGLSILLLLFGKLGIDLPQHMTDNSVVVPRVAAVAPVVFKWISDLFPSFGLMLQTLQEYLIDLLQKKS